jgi:predicted dinucleotide-binding enzyme
MRIGIIGSGPIGVNAAWMWIRAGHEVMLSFSRDRNKLERIAEQLGPKASLGTPPEAVTFGDVVMLAVRWTIVDEALRQAGPLDGKIVIDTCNQFGPRLEFQDLGMTAARFDQNRMPGAKVVKSYNTLTAGFQHSSSGRTGPDRVAMFFAGDDPEAKKVVARLIEDSGFTPIDIGGLDDAAPMEAPRRPGAVYGEELHEADARDFVARLKT